MKKISVFLIALILGFSSVGWAKEQLAVQPKTYFFEAKMRKEMAMARVSGSDCSDLKGSNDLGLRIVNGFWPLFSSISSDGAAELPTDEGLREFLRERSDTQATFVCVPYVKNIQDYLEKGAQFDGNSIKTIGGPVLFYYYGDKARKDLLKNAPPENNKRPLPAGMLLWGNDSYWKIKSLSNCSDHANEFCARIAFFKFKSAKDAAPEYSEENFRVFCWDCKKLKSSPVVLQKAYLFTNQKGVVFDGAFMINESNFFAAPLPAVQNDKRAQQYAAAKEVRRVKKILQWEELRALAEKEMGADIKKSAN